jgi:hypothetical protein
VVRCRPTLPPRRARLPRSPLRRRGSPSRLGLTRARSDTSCVLEGSSYAIRSSVASSTSRPRTHVKTKNRKFARALLESEIRDLLLIPAHDARHGHGTEPTAVAVEIRDRWIACSSPLLPPEHIVTLMLEPLKAIADKIPAAISAVSGAHRPVGGRTDALATSELADGTRDDDDVGPLQPLSTNRVHRGRGGVRLLIALLLLNAIVSIASLVSTAFQLGLLASISLGDAVDLGGLDSADARQRNIGITSLVIFVITGVAWLMWQHRAHSKLRVAGLEFSPGLAVGIWFIPIVNWFFPYQSVRELWQASSGRPDWAQDRWSLLGWWWGSFLASGLAGLMALGLRGQAVSDALVRSYATAVNSGIKVIAAILAIQIVRAIHARQATADAAGSVPARADFPAPIASVHRGREPCRRAWRSGCSRCSSSAQPRLRTSRDEQLPVGEAAIADFGTSTRALCNGLARKTAGGLPSATAATVSWHRTTATP